MAPSDAIPHRLPPPGGRPANDPCGHRMTCLRPLLVVLALTGALSRTSPLAAQPAPVVSQEYRLKAKVLEILGQSVTWPQTAAPAPGKPLTIGVLGRDTFDENRINQLDAVVAAAKAKGTTLVIQRFDSVRDYKPCHILFVSNLATDRSEEKTLAERLDAIQKAAAGSPVLLVGESKGLATQGAVANLVFDRATNLIQLEINPDAARRAGLTLAPGLLRLKLIKIVRDPPG